MSENNKLLHVVSVNEFGICPECGKPLMLLKAEYTAYALASSGWINKQVDQKSEFKRVCPSCGFTDNVKITAYGLLPEGYSDEEEIRKPILKNPIVSK